eukprot:CAMPEP_0119105734 /NCGR_PEP_ID=MMETSP1180-20130426/3625_1 /TAXON_ID=3052 ORGANISM="Chlamydomonas cf sp, Strain CCMP681" /NCGR_SAMPLE_ID=MMETSP1180 /ASSEMBLY_ACC=CAM_ASM_000741 /LENGTH=531 /DNA_ID=CAMNT_0007090871 /DNA_START=71 /DNA_END=1666 /DNA_ORIENTATION=-
MAMLSKARDEEERRVSNRRKDALVLILRHLVDAGYLESYQKLCAESGLSLAKVDVADNMDLLTVMHGFDEVYEMKYGRRARMTRAVAGPTSGANFVPAPPAGVLSGAGGGHNRAVPRPGNEAPVSGALAAKQRRERGLGNAEEVRRREPAESRPRAADSTSPSKEVSGEPAGTAQAPPSLQVQGCGVTHLPQPSSNHPGHEGDSEGGVYPQPAKPLPVHLYSGELRTLAESISRDIFTDNPGVRWTDISGLAEAKRLLQEAVVQPIKYPHLFTGLLAPWKGVLLYGPPGTGKTLLAKAVATECHTTFFNVQASTIVSKWRGESEKLVRVLFDLARHHAPSTIFMDEIDALMTSRGGDGEHEASRRTKTELLIQMDGLAKSSELVFVLTATNLPWELDTAMLRRLEKRILVPLPEESSRANMFQGHLQAICEPSVSWTTLASLTDGYSGSDIFLIAKEAAMRPLRRLMEQLERAPAAPAAHASAAVPLKPPVSGPVLQADVQSALTMTKPSARQHQARYLKFNEEYGNTSCQ